MSKTKTYKYTVTIEYRTEKINKVKDARRFFIDTFNRMKVKAKIVSVKKSETIKVRSAKNKAVKFQNWIAEQVSSITGIPCGKDELIQGREMGQSGVDIKLYGVAKEKYPFSVEAKNQKTFSLSAWVEQSKSNEEKDMSWQLFITKNNFDKIVVMDADDWFNIWEEYLRLLYGKRHKIKN